MTRAYALTGIRHDRLKTSVPFPVDLDVPSTPCDAHAVTRATAKTRRKGRTVPCGPAG